MFELASQTHPYFERKSRLQLAKFGCKFPPISKILINEFENLCSFYLQVIFQVALAILDANRAKLLSVDDDGEGMTILSEYLDNVTNREYDSPFKSAASSVRSTVTSVHVCIN